jgi:hypothetical protein
MQGFEVKYFTLYNLAHLVTYCILEQVIAVILSCHMLDTSSTNY